MGANAQDAALREPHVQPIEMAGRIMTGFVRIAPEGYQRSRLGCVSMDGRGRWMDDVFIERLLALVQARGRQSEGLRRRPRGVSRHWRILRLALGYRAPMAVWREGATREPMDI